MKASSIIVLVTTALVAVSAQAMGSGHNLLRPDAAVRAKPIAVGGAGSAYCRAVSLAGTQQRAAAARGSCVVVAQTAGNLVGRAGGVRTGTLMQGDRTAQSERVATVR